MAKNPKKKVTGGLIKTGFTGFIFTPKEFFHKAITPIRFSHPSYPGSPTTIFYRLVSEPPLF